MSERYRPTPQDYKLIFEDHKVGAAILEQLTQVYAKSATTTGGIDAILKTFESQGEWNVIQFIVTQINRANGVDVNQKEE